MPSYLWRVARRICALAILLGFGLSLAESVTCAEEPRVELVSQHAAELAANGQPAPDADHCCPCVHTFVSTVRSITESAAPVLYSTRFDFTPARPIDHRAEPLLPPPIV